MLIDNHAIAQGEALRAQIDAATAAFLNAGGKIQLLPDSIGKPIEIKPVAFNNAGNLEADLRSRKRGARNSAVSNSLPLRKRGTPQAKQNEALREVWP
jgi:hypothetical protein